MSKSHSITNFIYLFFTHILSIINYILLNSEEMDNQENITKVLKKSKVKGNIEFKHVKFGYDESRVIINDFSAKATPAKGDVNSLT